MATGLYIKGLRFSEISPPASTSTTKKEKKYILHCLGSSKQIPLFPTFYQSFNYMLDNLMSQSKCLAICQNLSHPLREKCPYSSLLWLVFSRIWTEYGPE